MRAWQPATVEYPDAELVLTTRTRTLLTTLDEPDAYVGREVPQTFTTETSAHATAIIWNRVGGLDPTALMQLRVFAPTPQRVNNLTRALAARLPSLVDGAPITRLVQSGGPTDLGDEPSPMRQCLYDVTFRGVQL